MCGIAGIITPNAKAYQEPLRKMTQSIAHRGPDAEKFAFFPNAALGHRRLSIIDLSENGDQPMYSNTRNECIVLNGEIYGYQKIKENYREYPYQSTTDTELILAMYQKKGEHLLGDLPGMFAFALWDEKKQSLLCARDRFGEKPFYYAIGKNGEFVFASEIKAILATGLVEVSLNEEALYHYLKYGYVSAYQSIYQNIKTLPPAHSLHFQNGNCSLKRYWKLPSQDINYSLNEAIENFNSLLDKAIQNQLVADVEVGSFLSGGLDSSTIVAKASQYVNPITTLAFGYEGEMSELPYAKEIAEKYQTNHIEILEEDFDKVELLQKVLPFFDEPFMDMSMLPTFEICHAARQRVKVMLSGDVGDELFGGYHFYRVESAIKNNRWYKKEMAKVLLRAIEKFRPMSYITHTTIHYGSILEYHQNHVRNYLSEKEIRNLGIVRKYHQPYSFTANQDSLNDIMRTDLEKYVPGNMLVKADRMAMANSLEVRTPFLDVDFASFCISLTHQLKVNSEEDKIILREACQELWTENIRKRSKKGFGGSVSAWFEEDKQLNNFAHEVLTNPEEKVFGYIDFKFAQTLLNDGVKRWSLLILALWSRNSAAFLK